MLQDARHAAEGEIYTKLNQKIDEFIQLADYEWSMAESDGRASGYLMDLINFLRSTFQVFTHLPVSPRHCLSAATALRSWSLSVFHFFPFNFYFVVFHLPSVPLGFFFSLTLLEKKPADWVYR